MASKPAMRRRANSVQNALGNIETDPAHHLTGSFLPQTPLGSNSSTPEPGTSPVSRRARGFPKVDSFYHSKGLWDDFKTLRWMRVPSSSFKMLLIPIVLYLVWELFNIHESNPFAAMIFISYPLSRANSDDPRYGKGYLDVLFVAYHIIVFSFIRQFSILEVIIPLARRLGLRKQAKLDRFGEQGYSMAYYGIMGIWGVYIMSTLPTWWYRTEHYWIDYPHWEMKPLLKRYYLMHLSYWMQQLIVLALKLEKPRKDFKELVIHHLVTLYLISWSYGINYTLIGNAVFVSMDIPDAFLAFSKCCNYLQMVKTKTIAFIVFVFTWTYFRHWLNLVILWSVINQSDLAPEASKVWSPPDGFWMPWWMKYMIFFPIFLLQLLNLFWYFLIWRVLIRAVTATTLDDERSDDEGEDES